MRAAAILFATAALAACAQDAGQIDDKQPNDTQIAPTELADGKGKTAGGRDVAAASIAIPVTKPVLCSPLEQPVFLCSTDNGKRIAVCSRGEGTVEYRYGSDTAEITLTASEYAQTMYSGGNEVQIGFDNGDTRYVVFSRMIRTNFAPDEPNDPAISDGVIVLKAGEFQSMRLCSDSDSSGIDLNVIDASLPRAEDLLTYETGRADR